MPTPRRQGRRELLGAATVLLLGALALAVFFLDRLRLLLLGTFTVVALLPRAPGVRAGSPVWVAGVPEGRIRSIALLPPGNPLARLALDLQLRGSVQGQLRRDSRIGFGSATIVGERVLDLLPGSRRSPALADGDTLRAGPLVEPGQVLDQARALRLGLDSLALETAGLRQRLARRGPALQRLARQAGRARKELARLRGAAPGLAGWAKLAQPGGPLPRLHRSTAELEQRWARARAGVRRDPLGRRISALRRPLDRFQEEYERLQALLRRPAGSARRLETDSALEQAFQGVSARLDSLVTDARRRPLRYVF
jgi:hypothetical protein